MRIVLLLFASSLIVSSCLQVQAQKENSEKSNISQNTYWDDGLAEINRYALDQVRYGESRQGDLVQIFVTEDFLINKQVKNESYTSKNSTRVLKRIETRQFNTGLYQYNMFSSAFTPMDQVRYPHSLKVSCSSQEWCGTTYSQLNRTKDSYRHTIHSYFENEADGETLIKDAISEEELFTRIRLNPASLPQGEFNLIPSQMLSRFLHLDPKSIKSQASLTPYSGSDFDGDKLMSYTIDSKELNRTLEIVYESSAPYTIVGWTDAYSSYFDKDKRKSIARLTHQSKEAYWRLNQNSDEIKRQDLGLD